MHIKPTKELWTRKLESLCSTSISVRPDVSGAVSPHHTLSRFRIRAGLIVQDDVAAIEKHWRAGNSVYRQNSPVYHALQIPASEVAPSVNMAHCCAAITFLKANRFDEARAQYANFLAVYEQLDEQSRNSDPELSEQAALLLAALQECP